MSQVTVTAPCAQPPSPPPPAGAGNAGANPPNAVSTSVIAAPSPAATDNAATVRKFVTQAADIKPGLTSLPVAVASALGADPNAMPGVFASGAGSMGATGGAATVTASAVAPAATGAATGAAGVGVGSVAGATFTTSGEVMAGRSSVPVASAVPSAA